MASKPKPCRYCGRTGHWPYQCFKNPSPPKYNTNRRSRRHSRWLKVRRQWFLDHPASTYSCYICGKMLYPFETTLDHVKPRGSHPELRYDPNNLEPCCWFCQSAKGSKSLALYVMERLLVDNLNVTPYARKLVADQAIITDHESIVDTSNGSVA